MRSFDENAIVVDKQPKPTHELKSVVNTVMLIDDSRLTNELHERMLFDTSRVKEVIKAGSEERAIEMIRERKEKGYRLPEVIFLDIMMPKTNGWEFLDRLKKEFDDFKPNSVVVLSASPSVSHLMECSMREEVQDFITKPMNEMECKRLIDEHLNFSKYRPV